MILHSAPTTESLRSTDRQVLFNRIIAAETLGVRHLLVDLNNRLGPHLAIDTMGRLELVLAEILNNIVNHGFTARAEPGGARRIHLSVACHEGGVSCAVLDDGDALPGACLTPSHPSDRRTRALTLPEGGFGWLIIHDLTQSLAYYREDGFNLLAFNVPATHPPAA